jgi:hypothetical protein
MVKRNDKQRHNMPSKNNKGNRRRTTTTNAPERVGDITGKAPTNIALDRDKAAKMADLLEGLHFPATKGEILHFINRRINHKKRDKDIDEVVKRIQQYLDSRKQYQDVFEIGQALGLVRHLHPADKPYVRDRAMNTANKERLGETLRSDPYHQNQQEAEA